MHWVEESKNDLLTEAVFDRQQRIHSYLGVEIVGTATGNYSEYVEPFKTAVKNKDGSVDMLLLLYGIRRQGGKQGIQKIHEQFQLIMILPYFLNDFK